MRTSPRALAALSGGVAASLIASMLVPASALALPQVPPSAPLAPIVTNDDNTPESDSSSAATSQSGDDAAQSAAAPATPIAGEAAQSAHADTPADAQASGDNAPQSNLEAPPAPPVKPVPVPDPLDFAKMIADPVDLFVPKAADRFKNSDGTYTIGRPLPGGPNAGTAVPGLEDFYGQKIEWGPCEPFAPNGEEAFSVKGIECGYLVVPLDYSKPEGLTIAIGLLKVPASQPEKRIGTLFMDPGGPGGSGMQAAAAFAEGTGVIRERFDYVGFDPRGVGSSLPMIRCQSSHAFDTQRQGSDRLMADQKNAILDYNTQQCYTNTGKGFTGFEGKAFIDASGTGNVIRDLDIARAAVGDPKINYLGYSYGTSIGYQYAMSFPDNIRAMIIDGVVNPFENNPEEAKKYEKYTANTSAGLSSELAQLQGFQSTFNQFLKACAANDGFTYRNKKVPCAVGTSENLEELTANYHAIVRKAWGETPYATSEATPRPLSFRDAVQGVIAAMYSESRWAPLNYALHDLKENNRADIMMLLADSYYERGDNGKYSFANAAFQSIWCTDSGTPEGANEPAAVRKKFEDQYSIAPFTDPGKNPDGTQRGVEPENDWCTYYKTQKTLPKGKTLTAMPNILVVSTTYDPATPYQDGVVAADALGGTLLTVAANNHCSYWAGGGDCAAAVGDRYLVDLVVPTDQTGAKGVETKNILSEVITGDECQIHSFRPEVAVAPAKGAAGTEVQVSVSGLVRNTDYVLTVPDGFSVKGVARATVEGVATFTVVIPAGATPGDVEVSVAPSSPADNDPTVTGKGTLAVTAPSAPPATGNDPSTGNGPAKGDDDTAQSSKGGKPAGDKSSATGAPASAGGKDGVKSPAAEKKLASTGASAQTALMLGSGIVVLGALLLGVSVFVSRRKGHVTE